MFAEYWRGYSECDAKQSFRMTVMLFEAFDPDDYEDAEVAWQTTRYDLIRSAGHICVVLS